METLFWYDYETWGKNPAIDRPVQFAGVRTDLNLNVIEEPVVLFCKLSQDLLPDPIACLITGITPQEAHLKGMFEYEFAAAIHAHFSKPNTCVVGFNNIRFDDECSRYLFYRNFYDPYSREWAQGNSRWDIIDLVRACYALRPDGVAWFIKDDNQVSFKLEHIAAVNKLNHNNPHNALSDVYTTIELARLIKTKQPKLFDYFWLLRNKNKVYEYLNLQHKKYVLHISGMFSVKRYCSGLIMPITQNPNNKNEIICYDLSADPTPLIELNVEEIQKIVFSANHFVIPLKGVHVNRSPFICNHDKILNDNVMMQRLQIDTEECEANYRKLLAYEKHNKLTKKVASIYCSIANKKTDPELMLYDAFFNDADKNIFHKINAADGLELKQSNFEFHDPRLPELFFRYRARNFPETLTEQEQARWKQFCYQRLTQTETGIGITASMYRNKIKYLMQQYNSEDKFQRILEQLIAYINELSLNFNYKF